MTPTAIRLILWALAAVNLLTLALWALDKLQARRHRSRVPERVLLGCAALGGALGAAFGMALFRHKTNGARHPGFVVGVPVLLTLQLAAAVWAGLAGKM